MMSPKKTSKNRNNCQCKDHWLGDRNHNYFCVEDNEWKDVQKKDTNKRPSETRNKRKTTNKIINKTSYFISNSLNKSLACWNKVNKRIILRTQEK